jgi:hypothetical protein
MPAISPVIARLWQRGFGYHRNVVTRRIRHIISPNFRRDLLACRSSIAILYLTNVYYRTRARIYLNVCKNSGSKIRLDCWHSVSRSYTLFHTQWFARLAEPRSHNRAIYFRIYGEVWKKLERSKFWRHTRMMPAWVRYSCVQVQDYDRKNGPHAGTRDYSMKISLSCEIAFACVG